MEELFMDRNHAVMLAVRFAQMLGLNAGVGEDPLELGWSVLYIELPSGEQVSWRIPPEDMVGADWPQHNLNWDGHNIHDKRERIVEFLRDYFITLSLPAGNVPALPASVSVEKQRTDNERKRAWLRMLPLPLTFR